MQHYDLFSGVGGFALAARWMGWQTRVFVEQDKFCQKVLKKNFPNVPVYGDIHDFGQEQLCEIQKYWEDKKEANRHYSILTGGFP